MNGLARKLRKVAGTEHTYEVLVQTAPGPQWSVAGIVQRFGSLPSMQRWAGLPEGGGEWTSSRRLQAQAAEDVVTEYEKHRRLPL